MRELLPAVYFEPARGGSNSHRGGAGHPREPLIEHYTVPDRFAVLVDDRR
jgi:hypothetical protein